MHELAMVEEVVATVLAGVPEVRITRVRLEVGRLAAVVPEALRFCFDLCAMDTRLEGAALEILEIPGRGRCRDCGEESEMSDLLAVCRCGCPSLELVGGGDVRVKEVEVQ